MGMIEKMKEKNMRKNKILTIIIPTYNAEKFLDKCLKSFIIEEKEQLEKLQVIVVNDGSPDRSIDIANQYVEKYPDIFEVLNKENGGHGSAINEGVKYAKGKYFKIIDADDWVQTKELQKFIEKLEMIEADAVISDYKTYDIMTNKEVYHRAYPNKASARCTLNEIRDEWVATNDGMTFHGITYHTEFYRQQNYLLEEHIFYEDQEYATVPMSFAKSVEFTGICLYVYRVGDVNQSVAGQNQVKRLSHLDRVIDKILVAEKIPEEGKRYWGKKTSMVITSYYQIALLKNKNKKQGRELVSKLNKRIQEKNKEVYESVNKKCKVFIFLSYIHLSNALYDTYAPKLVGLKRKLLREK